MKEFLSNQHAWKGLAVVGAAALYFVSTLVPAGRPEAASGLIGLAGLLVGWLGMRRPVDSK